MDNQTCVTDIIILMDESGSMMSMGDEPINSVNTFINEQQKNIINDGATFTLITFNDKQRRIIDRQKLIDVKPVKQESYNPEFLTALNDAVCCTIQTELKSGKPCDKVLMIISDGEENSSKFFTLEDRNKFMTDVRDNYNWKIIFIGANLDVTKMGVDPSHCASFKQSMSGDLYQLVRQVSQTVNVFRRSKSEGYVDAELDSLPETTTTVKFSHSTSSQTSNSCSDSIIDLTGLQMPQLIRQ